MPDVKTTLISNLHDNTASRSLFCDFDFFIFLQFIATKKCERL